MSEGYIDISHNVVGLMLQREAEIAKAKCNNTAYLRQQAQMSLFVLKKHICQVGALLSVASLCVYTFVFHCCYPLFSIISYLFIDACGHQDYKRTLRIQYQRRR